MCIFSLALTGASWLVLRAQTHEVRFVVLGDRTGEAQPGVYEQIWRDTAADHPDFVINVGDTIQGENDATVNSEWQAILRMSRRYRRFPFFYTPGNHDVWDDVSAEAYQRYTRHPLHYSFDYGDVHIAVLDNSRTDDLPASELDWLEADLKAHAKSPIKFVFSHRPSWIWNAIAKISEFRLQRIATQWGARYIIAGHLHQMLHFEIQNVTYLSMASSGGHLRGNERYQEGWFFAHTVVTVHDTSATFTIKETGPPFGQSRVSEPADWGSAGLVSGNSNN